jgi:hypothetical protein
MSYIKRLDLQVQVIAVRRSRIADLIDANKTYQYDKLNWKIHTYILISPSCTTVNVVFCYLSLKNSLIIHEENTKKNHNRVVSVYVIQIHVDLHKL